MLLLVYISLLILSAITLYFFPKNQKYVCVPLFIVLTLTMGLTYGDADYSMYERQYNAVSSFDMSTAFDYEAAQAGGYSKDVAINVMGYFFNTIGCDYTEYKFITSFIALSILLYYIYRVTRNPLWVLFFYSLYPFLMDIIQVKNFWLEVFLFVSFYYYVYANKYNMLRYTGGVTVAALFHNSAIAYLPFVFIDRMLNSKKWRWGVYVGVALGLTMPLYSDVIVSKWMIIGLVLSSTDNSFQHYAAYTEELFNKAYLYRYMYVCGVVAITGFMRYRTLNVRSQQFIYMVKYIKVTFHLALYLCLFMPLFPIFTDVSVRLPRNTMLIVYVATLFYYRMETQTIYRMAIVLLVFLSTLFMARADLFMPFIINNVYIIFSNNYLFQLFD